MESCYIYQKINETLYSICLKYNYSVMDRGFVFSLIRTYMKDIATKMLQAGSVNNDSVQLWNLQVGHT